MKYTTTKEEQHEYTQQLVLHRCNAVSDKEQEVSWLRCIGNLACASIQAYL